MSLICSGLYCCDRSPGILSYNKSYMTISIICIGFVISPSNGCTCTPYCNVSWLWIAVYSCPSAWKRIIRIIFRISTDASNSQPVIICNNETDTPCLSIWICPVLISSGTNPVKSIIPRLSVCCCRNGCRCCTCDQQHT